jgi:glutamyl-tRNA reductase
VAHDHATLEDLETAGLESQLAAVRTLVGEPGVDEALALQTCNRVEAYVVVQDAEAGREALSTLFAEVDDRLVREMDHEESLRHLLRVAAGLESQVVGEDQILGQVKDALEDARAAGGVGPVLDEGVTKAVHLGERARTETAINEGIVSLASAAVHEAAAHRDLEGATALVAGAGEMGRRAAASLASSVDRLVVANRTVSTAATLAACVDVAASAVGLDAVGSAAADADVVVTATGSPDPIFDRKTLADAGEAVVVDIARPRDVAPAAADLQAVTVRSLDDLEAHTEETRRQRAAAAAEVEEMVETAFDRLMRRYKRKRADRVISAMYAGAERIKSEQVGRALRELDLEENDEAVVEAMADAIVGELMAAPADSLRDAAEDDDWSTIHTALQLFDPSDVDAEDLPAPAGGDESTVPEGVRD